MTDFIQVVGIVDNGSYTMTNKKNGKVKHCSFDFFERPLAIHGHITRTRELVEGTEEELKKEISDIFYKKFVEYLNRKESKGWTCDDPELDIDFTVSIASKKPAKWCLENLTIPQLLEMGMTCIKG